MRGEPHRLACSTAIAVLVLLLTGGTADATWGVALATGSAGQALAGSGPSTPTGVTATCTSPIGSTIKVTWNAVARATSYTVWQSTTSATTGYTLAASGIATTSWTSGSLATGNYWFEASAFTGTNWTSTNSAATAQRTILVAVCN